MIELLNLGISEATIKSMLELEPNIKDLAKEEIVKYYELLKELNCSNIQIVNIISSNPTYLTRSFNDIYKLITTLSNYGFNTLNVLFDANPYILNLDSLEIDNYINNRLNNNELLEDIVDELDSNPYLFNEI